MRCLRFLSAGLIGALLGWIISEPWNSHYGHFRDFLMFFLASLGIAVFLLVEQLVFHRRVDLLMRALSWLPLYILLLLGTIAIKLVFSGGEQEFSVDPDQEAEIRYLVLDTSSSMKGSSLKELKEAVGAYLEVLTMANSEDLIGVILFSSQASELVAPTADYSILHEQVSSLTASGGTNMTAGLALAKTQLEAGNHKLPLEVILLSDGEPNDETGVRNLLPQLEGIPVSCIGAGRGYNRDLLEDIGNKTGGHFYPADDIGQLTQVFRKIGGGTLTGNEQGEARLPFAKRALGWSMLGLCIGLAVIFGKRAQEMLPSGIGFFETLAIGASGGLVGGFLGACILVLLSEVFPAGPLARAAGFSLLGLTVATALFLSELLFTRLRGVGGLDALR